MKHNILFCLFFFKVFTSFSQEIHGVLGESSKPLMISFSKILQQRNQLLSGGNNTEGFTATSYMISNQLVESMADYGPIVPVDSSLLLPAIDTSFTFVGQISDNAVIPSTPKGAVSANYIITATSERIVFHNSSGAVLSSVVDESFWVNQDPTGTRLSVINSTPYYDKQADRFFIVAQNGQNLQLSNILIAVSENGNPLGNWSFYKIKTNSGDLTKCTHNIELGYNNEWFVVSTMLGQVTNNENPNDNYGYLGGRIFAFSRQSILNNSVITPLIYNFEFSGLVPSQVTGTNKSTISFLRVSNAEKAQYSLYQFGGITPTIKHITEISLGDKNKWFYKSAIDNTLPQKNMSSKTNGVYGDGGLGANIVETDRNLWVVHPVYFSTNGSNNSTSTLYSGIQWIKIDTKEQWIADWGRLIDTSTVTYNGFKVSKNSYEYPSISVNNSDDIVIVFNHFSPYSFPSIGYTVRLSNESYFRRAKIYKQGKSKYYKTFSGSINRWGYNSYIAVDPFNSDTFWMLGQYAEQSSTQDRWGVAWAKVVIP